VIVSFKRKRGTVPNMSLAQTIPTPHTLPERLELAAKLYREFQSRCFWHSPRDLVITEELIPFVVKGLRTYGGHRGFKLAARLQAGQTTSVNTD
jgi:hypothetical protein